MKRFYLDGHAESLLPDGGEWELVWHDEFDGTELDTAKWDYRLCMMGKRHEAWSDRGVKLDGNGNAVFSIFEENGKIVSSQLQTGYNFMDEPIVATNFGKDVLQWNIGKLKENKFTKTYGYFECRCKLQSKEGWWSAFWLQSPIIGASLNPAESGTEVDIMESFHPGQIAAHNAYTGGYGLDNKHKYVGGMSDLSLDEYHTFGVLWDKSGYTFYVDGKEDGKITDYISHCPEFILISTEAKGYRYSEHEPTEQARAAVGDVFTVDYVRVFDRKA